MVDIFSVDQQRAICQGTPVAVTERSLVVLTAAHCVRAAKSGTIGMLSPGKLRIKVEGREPGSLRSVRRIAVHPRFEDVGPGSVYDFALLETEGGPAVHAIPGPEWDSGDVARTRLVVLTRQADAEAVKTPVALLSETSLTLTFRDDSGAVCQGQSGAPVLDETSAGARLLGIVSHGARDCRLNVTAGKVVAIGSEFLRAFLDGSPMRPLEESCAACTERVGGGDRCHIAMSRCLEEASCRQLLECESTCATRDCQRSCARQSPRALALADAARRCVCGGGCRSSCARQCDAQRSCGLSARDPGCHGCRVQHCCAESQACSVESDCAACVGHAHGCQGGQAIADLNRCIEQHCREDCLIR